MDKENNHLETLSEIRSIMERSSRFISLSGLSGIAAGVFALIGASLVYVYLDMTPFEYNRAYYVAAQSANKWGMDYKTFFVLNGLFVLVGAIASGIYFTTRKAKQRGHNIWDTTSQRLLINLVIPLIVGGLYCLNLHKMGDLGLVAPTTLIFYGLALINASKYTLSDIRYLGFSEIILGLIGLIYVGNGLELWALGFGVLHIIYGIVMYNKYERA